MATTSCSTTPPATGGPSRLGQQPQDVLPEESLTQLQALCARLVCALPETQRAWAEEYMDDDVLVLSDHTGDIKKWFDDRPTQLVFLRADRFVAGACLLQQAPATLDAILHRMAFTSRSTAVNAVIPDKTSSAQD